MTLGITIFIVVISVFCVLSLSKVKMTGINNIFDWIPPILFAYIIPAFLVKLLKIEVSGLAIFNWSKNFLVPFAIILVMTTLTVQQLKFIGWKPILVFISGSFWIATFPILYLFLFYKANDPNLNNLWQSIPPIVGSWIGGSTSQIVLKEVVQTPEDLFLSVIVLDNLFVNVWTILMFKAIQNSDKINLWFQIDTTIALDEYQNIKTQLKSSNAYLGVALLVGVTIGCYFLPISYIARIIVTLILGLILSSTIKIWDQKLMHKLGHIIIVIIMAILGLKLDFTMLTFQYDFVLLLLLWLISHYIFMVLIAKFFNINFVWVTIASMANVGGIATAPAVTATYNKALMPYAVILAVLSMVTGTAWGLLTVWLYNLIII
jgi:uncharacterized membrane protein